MSDAFQMGQVVHVIALGTSGKIVTLSLSPRGERLYGIRLADKDKSVRLGSRRGKVDLYCSLKDIRSVDSEITIR